MALTKIESTGIADDAITASKLPANSVGASELADDAVDTDAIADDAVTNAKIASNAVNQDSMADNAVGIGELAGIARGKVIYGDSSGNPALLTVGSSGQVLISNGTDISWGAVDTLPSQSGQAGEYLQTDGTDATWEAVVSATATAVSDQANTSTGYFDVPAGTTAQRPGSPAVGNVRVNTTINQLEHYIDGGWVGFGGSNPTISNVAPTTSAAAGTTITVTGINFQNGSIIKLIGTDSTQYNPTSTTFVSATEMQFATPELPVSKEPYDVKVTLPSGGFAISTNILDAGGVPSWTTAAGSLGTISHAATGTHFTLVATDPDSQTVTFSMSTPDTTTLTNAGFTLNASTGAITGDPTDVSTSTTYNFDVVATDSTGVNTTSRSFSITATNYFASASGGTTSTYSHGGANYKLHKFTSNGTFTAGAIGGTADVLIIAGGGGGGWHSGAGGGAGGMIWESIAITGDTTPSITIGPGGAGRSGDGVGYTGSNSVLSYNTSDTLTALGGGGGGYHGGAGTDGGSGGGGSRSGIAAGSATQSSSTDGGYGNDGGYLSSGGTSPNYPGHGGGGAGTAGAGGSQNVGGVGGDGKGDFINSSFAETNAMLNSASAGVVSGSYRYIAGGGGGSMQYASKPGGAAGKGGAGAGGNAANGNGGAGPGGDGTANTGSGGGGTSYSSSGQGDGGSGIVIIRYLVS